MKSSIRYLFFAAIIAFSLSCQALTLPWDKTSPPTPTAWIPGQGGSDGATTETPVASSAPLADTCAAAVDGIYDLRRDLGFPKNFQEENAIKQGGEFDPNRYFEVLTHLGMEPGYTLDYAYRYDGMGGGPLLYARKTGDEPFKTAAELQAAFTTPTPEGQSGESPASFGWNEQYLSHVQVDGTPEGYLEFTTLALTGGQFYLFWHSNYYDDVVMCNPDSMKYVAEALKGFDIELPANVQAAAKKIDYEPTVNLDEDTVTVRLVTFSKWGGFTEETYVIDRQRPAHLLESRTNTLIEYNCGIMF